MLKHKRFYAVVCLLALLAAMIPSAAFADSGNWWEEDDWSREVLEQLGAEIPKYNAAEDRYEIGTPEQLLFLASTWKPEDANGDGAPDAPCNGTYVLTADLDMAPLMEKIGKAMTAASGTKTQGWMPPVGAFADETEEEGIRCAFFGEFDGQGHSIRNLRIVRRKEKYAGLFGNIGHDYGEGAVRNLAVLDADIYSMASAGILSGAVYGDVENVICTGKITVEEKTAGGLTGKVKRNDNGYYGVVRDCVVYADITVLGLGSENGAAGLITSSNSKGGMIYNCLAGGTITIEGERADSVGGVTGNLKGGLALDNCVMLAKSIEAGGKGSQNIGLLCGAYSGDTGSHIHNNYVWEGARLSGTVTNDHPDTACFETVSAAEAASRSFYDATGWDFDSVWTWAGDAEKGVPTLRTFADSVDLTAQFLGDLELTESVLQPSEPTLNKVYEGEAAVIRAYAALADGDAITGGTLYYGTDKNANKCTDTVPMTADGNVLSATLRGLAQGTYYYYYTAEAGGKTLTFPANGTIRLNVVSTDSKYAPSQLTVSPGEDRSRIGVNWITEDDVKSAELRYREVGAEAWETAVPAESYRAKVGNDHGEFASHSVDLTGLKPSTAYEYVAVTNNGTKEFVSDVHTFTTLPDGKEFSFIVISDLQGTSEEGYLPYLYTSGTFLTDTIRPDFVINAGDLTEDDTMAEWSFLFNTIGDVLAGQITAYVPGNHEYKGDAVYTHFKGRTNLPGGIDDEVLKETTSAFVVGDVCFVTLNTDPFSGKDGADAEADKRAYYEAEKEWAKAVFEASGCTWRIICGHAGLVQGDDDATAFLEKMCEELDVDLFFNGHIHNYFRASVNGSGEHAAAGEATTFITSSPMGTKFDPYGHEIDDVLDFQTGGKDDERQYLTYVEVKDGSVTVTAYRRSSDGEPTKKSCAAYDAIDTFTLEKAPAPAQPAGPSLTYILGPVVFILIAATALILTRKKKYDEPES